MSNSALTYAVLLLRTGRSAEYNTKCRPSETVRGEGQTPPTPTLPALYVSNCSVPTPATRCLQGNQTHYISPDVLHNYKIHFPALFFWNWAKWWEWWQPSKCWILLQPLAHYTRGLRHNNDSNYQFTPRAVRKRGEQSLEASAEEWTDRRTVCRDVCGPQGRSNVRRRKSARITSRNVEAMAALVERARIIFEWYSNVFHSLAEGNWQYGIPYCGTEHVMSCPCTVMSAWWWLL
jgi:hypothetical protein